MGFQQSHRESILLGKISKSSHSMRAGIDKHCPVGEDWLRPDRSTRKVVTESIVPTPCSIEPLKRNDCRTTKRFHEHWCDDAFAPNCEWAADKMLGRISRQRPLPAAVWHRYRCETGFGKHESGTIVNGDTANPSVRKLYRCSLLPVAMVIDSNIGSLTD